MSNIEKFGKYILLEKIATGGMAEIYLAKAPGASGINKYLAIKRILPQYSENPEFIEMFKAEAKIAINLAHSNIVSIYEFGVEKGQFFLVMDYVEGKNLRQVINRIKQKRETLQIDQILYIIREVAAGLDSAHRCLDGATGRPLNITHRDMSPQNIMLSFEGEVKICDFGIAKAPIATGDDLTNDNIMMGTAKYLSPELVRGKPLDGRADLYGLGLVLYECLAGRVPFIGETDADTALARLQREPTDLGRLRPSLSPQLIKVIHKLLARNPDHRFATGAETRAALISAGTGRHDHTTSITPPSGIESATIVPIDKVQRTTTSTKSQWSRIPGEPTPTLSPQRVPTRVLTSKSPRGQLQSSNRRLLGLIGAIVVLCSVVLWQVIRDTRSGATVAENTVVIPSDLGPLSILSASSFDPNGDDGHENESQIGALIDGNPSTTWTTTCYSNQYFGSKEFVGVLLQLSRLATGTLGVGISNAPWTIEIYATQDVAPGQLSEWGQPVDKAYSTTRQRGIFKISKPANYLLVVLREVGRSNGCSDANPYQGILSGVTFGEG